jgi:hypothetical protein
VSSSRKPSKKPSRARSQAPRAREATRPAASAPKRPAPRGRRPSLSSSALTRKSAPAASPPPKPATPPPRPGIRLAGSAASRLTIKPSPPQGPRPQLLISTKPRPSGQRPLSEVELDEDEVLTDGFDATLAGERVRITAVLERTCVYVDRVGDRRLARKEDLLVEADKLPIRRRGIG